MFLLVLSSFITDFPIASSTVLLFFSLSLMFNMIIVLIIRDGSDRDGHGEVLFLRVRMLFLDPVGSAPNPPLFLVFKTQKQIMSLDPDLKLLDPDLNPTYRPEP